MVCVMYMPAHDQWQYTKSRRPVVRARSTEREEDVVNKHRTYARMGHMRCEPLSDEEVYALARTHVTARLFPDDQ